MTFKEFCLKRKSDYGIVLLPMLVVFMVMPFLIALEWWYYPVVLVISVALFGFQVLQHYNRWYPYYNPKTGMLREAPHDDN